MKSIVQFAVKYPVTISMLIFGILLLGYISFDKLSIDLFPEMKSPRIYVEIRAGERPPEEIEKLYIEGMESLIIRQKGVSQVSSVCMVGASRIKVEFNWGTDMDEAFLELQKSLNPYSQDNGIQSLSITQHDPNASPIVLIAMSNPAISDMNEMRKVGENFIRNELIRLEGVADVKLTGTEEKEIVIETDPYRLNAYGLSADNLVQQIMSMNRNVSGGSIVEMGKRYIIKGTSLLATVSDLENIVITFNQNKGESASAIPSAGGGAKVPVYLKDVASVHFQNKKPENIVHINGKRCVGLAIYKETNYNTVKAVEELTKSMEGIKKALPGYQFVTVQDQGKFIQSAIDELKNSALIGAILSILILFLFLRRIGITAIVSFVLPVSIVATFALMYFSGLTLNIMTLGGLALGAGMLVDNAIVIVENIFRHIESGLSVRESAIKGTTEVSGPIISSTITTIVVFLPIVYLHGASGALFKDQAWTVAFSQVISLVIAILIIPMLFNVFYSKSKKTSITKALHFNWYGKLLSQLLNKRYIVIALAALILVVTILILPKVGSEFIPKSGTNEFSINIKLKEGTQIQRTEGMVRNLEVMLAAVLDKKADIIYSQVGPSETASSDKSVFQNENTASIKIKLNKDVIDQSESIINQVEKLVSVIPDAEISILRDETALQSTIGTDEPPLVVEVKGKDLKELDKLSTEIKQNLASIPEVFNLKTSLEEGAPEIDVVVDRYKASVYNLSAESISKQLQDILMGKNAGKYDNSGELNDISVRMPELNLTEFNTVMLKSGNKDVPLYEVARLERVISPKQVLRNNQSRIGTITADIDKNIAFDKVIAKVNTQLKEITPPAEYQIQVTGEEQKRKEAMASLGFALLLSIILVYMVMASQFESLIHPFTVLLTIPLAAAGSVLTFFFLGMPLNMMAYIGIIMLGGIAVNNSILLVDAINQYREENNPLKESIVMACQNRIRPILMTSLSSILGLVPLTLGFGESAALRSPMAIALISGLIASTVMSLVVIPCVYYVFDRRKKTIPTTLDA